MDRSAPMGRSQPSISWPESGQGIHKRSGRLHDWTEGSKLFRKRRRAEETQARPSTRQPERFTPLRCRLGAQSYAPLPVRDRSEPKRQVEWRLIGVGSSFVAFELRLFLSLSQQEPEVDV